MYYVLIIKYLNQTDAKIEKTRSNSKLKTQNSELRTHIIFLMSKISIFSSLKSYSVSLRSSK
jgi:hypothetical protein